MDFLKQLKIWANGDALQGKIMATAAILTGLVLIFILNNDQVFLNGMIIPLSLLLIANLGYGSFLLFSRPKHLITTQNLYKENSKEAIKKELEKAMNDHKAYSILQYVWIGLMIVSVVLWFVLSGEYYKGLSIGLIIMSIGGFLIDTFLHRRLKPYLMVLEQHK